MITCIIPIFKTEENNIFNTDLIIDLLNDKLMKLDILEDITEILVITNIQSEITSKIFNSWKIKFINRNILKAHEYKEEIVLFAKLATNNIILFTYITTPLIKVDTYNNAINIFLKKEQTYDCLISVNKMKRYFLDENGPINFSRLIHTMTYKLPALFLLINGFFISQKKDVVTWKYPWGSLPLCYELNNIESLEIRTQEDLTIYKSLKR